MLNRKTDSTVASSEYLESPDRFVQTVVEHRLLGVSGLEEAACGRSAADARARHVPAAPYMHSGFAAPRFLGSLLLAFFVLAGALAEAQTVTTLVSNAGQAPNTGGTNQIVAQSFTTGPHGTGYTLSSVRIRPFSASAASGRSGTYVAVKTDSGGEPGATLATLSDPNTDFTGFGFETFSAPADTTLEPDTTYWVVINEEQSTADRLGLGSTGSQAQDSDSLPGWEIGDTRLQRSGGTWTGTPSPLLIDVQGHDNGNPSLSVAPGSAAEGSAVRFTVTLDDPAQGAVTVQYATSDGSATAGADYTAATARTLTIPVGQISATIEVATIDDTDDEGDETFTLTLSNPSSNADLGTPASATGTIVDNDGKPSLIIAGAAAAEGSNLEFTVTASNAATADVTVQYSTSIASDDTASTGDFSAASGETLTIAAGEETATISIASIDDPDDEDDETFSVTLSSPSSNAELGLQVSAKGTIEDDDEPGIALSTPALEVTEGSDASYTVALATRPTGTVTVTIDAGSNSGVTLSTTREVFTAADWNQARTVIVSAAHDADADPGSATITHSASGPGYESVSGQLPVSVVDDEVPAILISPAPLLQVSENDTARYTVALATLPAHRVTLNLSGLANTGLTVQPSQLVFDTDNWNTPQSVDVSVAADLDADDSRATLTYTGSGGDYEGVSEQLEVDILDTVSASLVISTSRLQVKEGEASTYFVSLAPAAPTGNVTVRITPDSSQLRLGALSFGATGTLVFTPGNWNVPREVSVTAGEDVDEAPDHDALQHVASGGGFGSAPAVELPVLVEDDDVQRGYVFSGSELRVDEGGSASYTVKLRTRPELSSVTLNITGGGNLLSVEPSTLRFTRETWNNEQTVTVTAADQVSVQDVRHTLTHTGEAGPDTYSLIDPGLLSVVIDRDAPGIASSAGVTVTSTPLHAHDTYALGETIAIAVLFDDDVVVDDSGGTLHLKVSFGSPSVRNFGFAGMTGNRTLDFEYTVQASDEDANGIEVPNNALVLNGATVKASADQRDADLRDTRMSRQADHKLDGGQTLAAARLASLVVSSDGTAIPLTPQFSAAASQYTTAVTGNVGQVTISATAAEGGTATIVPADASVDAGHQVLLAGDETEVTVTVDRPPRAQGSYRLTLEKVDASVSIAADVSTLAFNLAGEAVNFTVTRDQALTTALDVGVELTQSQSFLAASALSRTVTIPANQTSATLTLDQRSFTGGADADGTLTASIAADTTYSIGSDASASVDLVAADPAVIVRPGSAGYAFAEDSGTGTVSIVAETAPGVPTPSSLSIGLFVYSPGGGSATSGVDYSPINLPLVFDQSDFVARDGRFAATKSFDVSLTDDSSEEGDEDFSILMIGTGIPDGVALGLSDGSFCQSCRLDIVIVDDDSPPAQVTGVTLTPGQGTLTVSWNAVNNADGYKVQWKSGEQVFDDAADDGRQAVISSGSTTRHDLSGLIDGVTYTVRVIATRAGAPGDGAPSAEVTGVPGLPGTPTLSIADAAATEGDPVQFTVTLDPAAAADVTVSYVTVDGTATGGTDYTEAPGSDSLTISAGQTSGTISVPTADDQDDEDDETFTLTLFSPSANAALGTSTTATGTIEDDDTTAATITGIAFTGAPSDGEYNLGDVIEISATFDRAVEVTGTPRIALQLTGSPPAESYAVHDAGASSSTVLVFRRTVTAANDDDTDGIGVDANALELNGGGIVNQGTTVAADLGHSGLVGANVRTRSVQAKPNRGLQGLAG